LAQGGWRRPSKDRVSLRFAWDEKTLETIVDALWGDLLS
jgi:hypothetical protein